MKLFTAEQMRFLDRISIEKIGIPGVVLMENAGRSVAELISKKYSSDQKVYIFCGPGNNGGDGFVVARHLFNKGYEVKVFLGCPQEKVKGDAAINLKIDSNMGIEIKEITSLSQLPSSEIEKSQVILVDAILGTGAKGAPRGIFGEMVNLINRSRGNKIAVDIPTGVDADTGEVAGEAVRANYTVTFGYPKRGMYLYPGMDYVGQIIVADIGMPFNLLEKENINILVNLLLKEEFSSEMFYRLPSSHKGKFGHLFVLAGSPGMTGAATLVCEGALKIGTGLVTLGIPESLNPILEVKLTEAMTLPLPETREGTLSVKAAEKIYNFIKKCEALVIGPGLSRNPETKELIKEILKTQDVPLVLDADGINSIAGEVEFIKNYSAPAVLTPHPGELARLVGESIPEIQKDRVQAASDLSSKTGKIAVLKGAGTVIADPEGNCWINTTGNAGMASGGTGDVLAGIIGGLLAQGKDGLTAAKLGVFLHGLAGDIAVQKYGQVSLTAENIIEFLPSAIRSLEE